MSNKIIVSYDGTANENDAIALGKVFARAGAEVSLGLRTPCERARQRSRAEPSGGPGAARSRSSAVRGPVAGTHVVTDPSTPQGLGALAEQIGAAAIVFCSDSHTAKGHVTIGNSAQRLLEGGSVAVAIAPAGLADDDPQVQRIVAVGEAGGDGSAQATAQALADALGAEVVPVADEAADLVVIDSRPEAEQGRVSLSSSARI